MFGGRKSYPDGVLIFTVPLSLSHTLLLSLFVDSKLADEASKSGLAGVCLLQTGNATKTR